MRVPEEQEETGESRVVAAAPQQGFLFAMVTMTERGRGLLFDRSLREPWPWPVGYYKWEGERAPSRAACLCRSGNGSATLALTAPPSPLGSEMFNRG
jgi:hypothetical protein